MNKLRTIAGASALVLLMAGTAFAQAGGHDIPWDNFAYRVITLAVVLGIIWYAGGSKIKAFFSGRASGIEEELISLETRKADAKAKLADVEQRIANMDAEAQSILDEYRKQGEAAQAAIIERAEKSAAQITEQASKAAENEVKQAMEQMREEMADLVAEAAEQMIAKKLDKKSHEALIDKYLTKVVLS
ncbi:F0F1 ATP synthase subunit B family protein [Halodesulfovibrio spirochaetisodalis]|uniref:ATP synthase subunit b n=1 Tax=Halodesulfovibrio spirochaetisodalis TaxID=1560234 RepID=A0A1B7XBX4_9BACT|nr:ATP synthase F0 subunit B [Halodesulfovibrio spirochaetisodalis]OBQ50250.1 ATP synthase subunit B [Halodesulfovibrio spirochaetisodalis]